MLTEKNSGKYHHGDLHSSLLTSATAIINQKGVDGLSMRKLAEEVGVSRSAAYHHFKDKNALLCAIAQAGFDLQTELLKHFVDEAIDESSFYRYVLAYLRFASENPQTYDLMFGKEIWKLGEPTPELKTVSKASFQHWVVQVKELQDKGVLDNEEPPVRVGKTCWATLHGLSRLVNDGIYTENSDLELMAKTAARMLVKR